MPKVEIRALVLAAGFGSRLKPLTLSIPKCLVEVGGIAIIDWWLLKLEKIRCSKVLVNTHYLPNLVEKHLESSKAKSLEIEIAYEESLLGTAGTLIKHREFFSGHIGMLIHADNATDMDLSGLLEAHLSKDAECILTMLTFNTKEPSSCGIVQVDNKGIVRGFHEKQKDPPGIQANGAVYLFNDDFWSFIDTVGVQVSDFSIDVLPKLVGKIQTFHTDAPFIDIGTPSRLEEARRLWPSSDSDSK